MAQIHYPSMHSKSKLNKRVCKSPEWQTHWHSEIAVQLEEPEQEEQAEQAAATP